MEKLALGNVPLASLKSLQSLKSLGNLFFSPPLALLMSLPSLKSLGKFANFSKKTANRFAKGEIGCKVMSCCPENGEGSLEIEQRNANAKLV